MKASDLLIRAIEDEGVEFIFGIPGEENLNFPDSLSRSKICLIPTRHEQAAGFMAFTYGRLTGKAGVCLSTMESFDPQSFAMSNTNMIQQRFGQRIIRVDWRSFAVP